VPGSMAAMSPALAIKFDQNPGVSASVNQLMSEIVAGGPLTAPLTISGLQFGSSAQDSSTLFSNISVDLTPVINNLNLIPMAKAVILNSIPIELPATIPQLMQAAAPGQKMLSAMLSPNGAGMNLIGGKINVAALQQKSMQADIGFQMPVPFDVNVNIGYFGMSLMASGQTGGGAFVNYQMPQGLKISTSNGMATVSSSSLMQFADSDVIQQTFGSFATNAFAGQKVPLSKFYHNCHHLFTPKTTIVSNEFWGNQF
jgi:hypothetical protein